MLATTRLLQIKRYTLLRHPSPTLSSLVLAHAYHSIAVPCADLVPQALNRLVSYLAHTALPVKRRKNQ